MRGIEASRSPRRTAANITGRTGSAAGFAASIPRYSSRILTNWPECGRCPAPRAPPPAPRHVEVGARRLCARGPDEQVALAELVSEVRQTVLDRAIQVADRCEVLQ